MVELAGQVAVITGAAGGIGLAMARALGDVGMRLVIADIDERRLAGAGESLRSRGHRAAGFTCDVREQRDMSQLRDFALDAFEDVYLVCLNAGGALPVSARSVTDNELADVLRLNHYGAINGVGRSSR